MIFVIKGDLFSHLCGISSNFETQYQVIHISPDAIVLGEIFKMCFSD